MGLLHHKPNCDMGEKYYIDFYKNAHVFDSPLEWQ